MQSLTQLNNYSNTSVDFVDLRPPSIRYNKLIAANQVTSGIETKALSYVVVPGIEILEIINPSVLVSYSFDLSANSSLAVVWPTLPSHLTTSVTGRVYTVTGIRTAGDWQLVRSPIITGTTPSSAFVMSATINFEGQLTSWNTTVSIIPLNELSPATGDASYIPANNSLIINTPFVVDTIPGFDTSAYVLTITGDAGFTGTFSSTGSLGGTAVASGPIFTITGSLEQVNSHLHTLRYLSSEDSTESYALTYSLWNPSSEFTSVKIQYLIADIYQYLSNPVSVSYDKNIAVQLLNAPVIIDNIYDGSWTVTIGSNTSNTIASMSSAGTLGGTSNFTLGSLTITGTKAQVNSHLSSITMQPGLNYVQNFTVRYTVITPNNGVIQVKKQQLLINRTDTQVSYDELSTGGSATYISGVSSTIANTPKIVPTTVVPFATTNYTLTITPTLTTGINVLSANGTLSDFTTKTLTLTGSASTINSALDNLHLSANAFTTSNITLNFVLTNPTVPFTSTESMTVTNNTSSYLSAVTPNTYDKNLAKVITGVPLIITSDTTSIYDISIAQQEFGSVSTLSSAGTLGGTSVFSNSTLTITGTKDQVNSHLSSITLQPGLNYVQNFNLWYLLNQAGNPLASTMQSCMIGNTNTVVTDVELTIPEAINYAANVSTVLSSTCYVIDIGKPAFVTDNYTMTITINSPTAVGSLSVVGGSGGSWSFTDNKLTITGCSRTQMNSRLENISYTAPDTTETFTLSYSLFNPTAAFYTNKTQSLSEPTATVLGVTTATTYDVNSAKTLVGYPTVIVADEINTYYITITCSPNPYSDGVYSFPRTLSGNKASLNSQLAAFAFQPGYNYSGSYQLTYSFSGNGKIGSRRQTMTVGRTDTFLTNTNQPRTYIGNTANQTILSSNTPQILETLTIFGQPVQYLFQISSDAGKFGITETSVFTTYTYTGTAAQVNAIIPTVKFYPTKGVIGTHSLTMTLNRLEEETFSYTPVLTGSGFGSAGTSSQVYFSNTAFTPTYEQLHYLKCDIITVGNPGTNGTPYNFNGSMYWLGGGAAGGKATRNLAMQLDTYGTSTITVTPSSNTQVVAGSLSIITAGAGGNGHDATSTSAGAGGNGDYLGSVPYAGGTNGAYSGSQQGGGGGGAGGAAVTNSSSPYLGQGGIGIPTDVKWGTYPAGSVSDIPRTWIAGTAYTKVGAPYDGQQVQDYYWTIGNGSDGDQRPYDSSYAGVAGSAAVWIKFYV